MPEWRHEMEFRDLKTQYLQNKKEIDEAIYKVTRSGCFIGGEPVALLEEQLAEYVGTKHCITCANGTDALQLALMAMGIGSEDAVFIPDFTFFSTGEVVPWVHATPVFVDISDETFNISATSLEKAIQKVLQEGKLIPKAVIAVDLFGQPADYKEIRKITEKYHMLLIEDGAQGFGGNIANQKACSFGDIATTSFFPAKPLGCYGDGGAVFTNNDEWAELIRSYKVHGKGSDKYDNIRIGMNSRLDTIQAAVLSEKLHFLNKEIESCNHVAQMYSNCLKSVVKIPQIAGGMESSWAQYTICLKDEQEREVVVDRLRKAGIPSNIYYKKPMHLQKAFSEIIKVETDCSVTEKVCQVCLSLPMHAYLKEKEIMFISECIGEALS